MRIGMIVCIVMVVLVCATALALFIRFKLVKRRNKRKLAAACAGPDASASIFVEMIVDSDAEAAGATLAALFETASCSLRVYVGVYELYAAGQPAVADAYVAAAARSTAAFCLKDHVRCLRVPAHEFKGVLSAMEQLRRFVYRGETFVMSIRPGTRFVSSWDTLAIQCLADATRRVGSTVNVVLSTLPANGPVPRATAFSTYVSIQPTSGAMLAHALRAKPSSACSTPALVWSSAFSFAKGSTFTACVMYPKLLDQEPQGIDALVHDYYVTLKLLRAGWHIEHPLRELVTSASVQRAGQGSFTWRTAVSALNRPLLPLLAARGITLDATHTISVSARAALGLTPDASTDEIVAKLGSIGEYLSVLTRLELDVNAQLSAPPQ